MAGRSVSAKEYKKRNETAYIYNFRNDFISELCINRSFIDLLINPFDAPPTISICSLSHRVICA